LSLFPVFSPLSSFQVRCAVPTSCVNTFQSTHHIVHPCNHLFPIISPSLSSRLDPRWMVICIRMLPTVTLSGPPATCSLALWLRVRLASVVIGYVFVLPALICFCDKPSPLPCMHFASLPLSTLPAITAITVTIIYASHRSKHVLPVSLLCRYILHFLCSITCSFPAIPFFRYPHSNVSFIFPSYIYRALDVL